MGKPGKIGGISCDFFLTELERDAIISNCVGLRIGGISLIGREKKPAYVAGIKQTRKAILNQSAVQVLLADNADPALTEPLSQLCQQRQIPVRWVSTMQVLGRALGLAVGAAAAAELRD
ncbi:MAG: ribosomal L7Ae/L30e/S12e/Gadd45 family protein [Oscillospiraceae bacterium]|nr:ribosomal L7Ae/L30e/S12e/Gadd45 family protein [Oscillospiraceae bacterium]